MDRKYAVAENSPRGVNKSAIICFLPFASEKSVTVVILLNLHHVASGVCGNVFRSLLTPTSLRSCLLFRLLCLGACGCTFKTRCSHW